MLQDDLYRSYIPEKLLNFVLYELPVIGDLKTIYEIWIQYKDEDFIIDKMRKRIEILSIKAYGSNYPLGEYEIRY